MVVVVVGGGVGMGFVLDGIICCESPLGTRLMKLKQLGDQIRICSADI